MPINRSGDDKIHCFIADGPLSNGRQEFTERATAFFTALEHAAPVDENDPFVDLEPDICKEVNEFVVYDD